MKDMGLLKKEKNIDSFRGIEILKKFKSMRKAKCQVII